MIILITYWLLTTIYGVYWLIKNPRRGYNIKEFSMLEVLAHIFPSMVFTPFLVPMMLLESIKFKR